jgi:hypothetical protein
LYQILIEEHGFRTAHTSTQHYQPVAPAVHRHETVLCRMRTSICKSHSRKQYGFSEQQFRTSYLLLRLFVFVCGIFNVLNRL